MSYIVTRTVVEKSFHGLRKDEAIGYPEIVIGPFESYDAADLWLVERGYYQPPEEPRGIYRYDEKRCSLGLRVNWGIRLIIRDLRDPLKTWPKEGS